jgi:hypothetical protein
MGRVGCKLVQERRSKGSDCSLAEAHNKSTQMQRKC